MSLLASIGSLFMLNFGYPFIRGDPSRAMIRTGLFGLFSFLYGLSLGPLLESLISISNDSVIPTAFLLTASIFVAFSASAIFSQRRSFIFLGGLLMGSMLVLSILGLMNIFFRSELLFNVDLYGGLLIFCGFILFDTQLIVERIESSNHGDRQGTSSDSEYQYDTIHDALKLFMDIASVFIRLATILATNSAKKEKEDRKGRSPTHRKMRG